MVSTRSWRATALALCLALTAPSLSAQSRSESRSEERASPPSRQELDEAMKRYKRGVELFNEGSYEASMLEFRKANELAPSYKILFNIAQVNRQLNDYARAIEFYERYLREGGSNINAARTAEVHRELEKLRPRVSKVEIVSNVAGASVSIDDMSVGRLPFAQPMILNAGRHKFVASAEGRSAITSVVEMAGSESLRVALDFPESPDPSSAASPAVAQPVAVTAPKGDLVGRRAAPDDDSSQQQARWLAWGATGVLAVGTGVTGLLALRAKSRYQDQQDSFGADPSEIDDRYNKAHTLGIVTDVLLGATLVAGGVSLYLTLSGDKKAAASARPTSPSWNLGFGPGYLGARATFLS